MLNRGAAVIACVLMACASGGCAHHKVKTANDKVAAKPAGVPAPNPIEASEAVVRQDIMHAVDDLQLIHFDYDSDNLKPVERAILKDNAFWLKANAQAEVQVAGHCDQRGTVEYNLALGQRRAKVVRDYYRKLGIAGSRIATISYGKEQPLCQEMDEDCWVRNRRSATLVAFPPGAETAPSK